MHTLLRSAVVVTVIAVAAGCGGTTGGQTALDKGPVGTHRSTTTPRKSPSVARHTNIDPIVGPYTPVQRNGKVPTPHIRASAEPFTKTVVYPDHISVRILSIHEGVTQGRGPGQIAGRPLTTMRIRFDNAGKKPIDLTQVVVSVIYGAPGRLASPIYDEGEQDFHSVVAPGASAAATYSFSIPRDSLDHVVMKVDFDGLHAAATFAGTVS